MRAGEYTAEWTLADLPPVQRTLIRAAPAGLRLRLALAVARRMVRGTFEGSRAVVHVRKGRGAVDIRGSVFCDVRDRAEAPLCSFYAAAIGRLLRDLDLDADVTTERCRATGSRQCLMSIRIRPSQATG
jgi:bacteriochlorophyll 4-vinyl reductase